MVSAWRQYFAEAAHKCSAEVAGLPKHKKFEAYKACMSRTLKGASKLKA